MAKVRRTQNFYLISKTKKGKQEVSAITHVCGRYLRGKIIASQIAISEVGHEVTFDKEVVMKALMGLGRDRDKYDITLDLDLLDIA